LWLQEEGIDPNAWLAHPQSTPALKNVVARLLNEADRLYKQAMLGIAELPRDCRSAILSAGLIYAEIGHQLRRNGLDSVHHRSVVSTHRKLFLLLKAKFQSAWVFTQRQPPQPLAGIAYLVEQCQETTARQWAGVNDFPNRDMPQRIEWMLSLLERLEHQRRRNINRRR
jgi:phytoene synthase